MSNKSNHKPFYDLEERTFNFAKNVRIFIKNLPQSIANIEDSRQAIKSSGSVGANYIEANEALSKKDFMMRIKISKKESKECAYWLRIISATNNENHKKEALSLYNEAVELKKIFSSIIEKSK